MEDHAYSHQHGYCHRWLCQYRALVRKNLSLLWFRPAVAFSLLLSPAAMLCIVMVLASNVTQNPVVIEGGVPLRPQRCSVFAANIVGTISVDMPCVTVAYSPNTPTHNAIMSTFAKNAGMTFSQDASVIADVVGYPDQASVSTVVFNGGADANECTLDGICGPQYGMVDSAIIFAQARCCLHIL